MSESLTPQEQKMFAERSDAEPGAAEPAATPAPEGAAAPETAPAPAEPTAEPKAEPLLVDEKKWVPAPALLEERERRKEAQRQVETERRERAAEQARMDERLRAIQDRLAPLAEAPLPKVPDFQQDPQGYIRANFEAHQRELAAAQQQIQNLTWQQQQQLYAQEQLRQHEEARQRAIAYGRQKEDQFKQTTPDYMDAVAHLRNVRVAQLQVLPDLQTGQPHTPQQIEKAINDEVMVIADACQRHGLDFADTLYRLSGTVHYTPKQIADQRKAAAAAQTNGAQQNPLAAVERGQRLAQGLGSAGAAPPKIPSADALANMSIEQFAEFLEKFPEQAADAMR